MGNPVAHSKSPFIHARFAAQTGQAMTYGAILVERGGFAEAVARFRDEGGRGLNVTVPFKEEAFALVAVPRPRAALAGAVNTLWFGEPGDVAGRYEGDNTDGTGLVNDLTANLGFALAGRRVLLLGAGGAARGVLGPLLAERPATFVVANRTHSRAETLARHFAPHGAVTARPLAELAPGEFDLIINATSASLAGELPPLAPGVLGGAELCYDMMYGAAPTPFLRRAGEEGARRCSDGLGMLVEQAAEAFAIWRGCRPATGPVLAALREDVSRL